MPVDSTHPLYDQFAAKWARARDVIAGEDAVKEAGEAYVARLDSQTDDEFEAYVQRATFFGATGRTAEGFSGMVFRRDPVTKLPDVATPAGKVLEAFSRDIDMLGTSLYGYVKHVSSEVMATGRGGTLVEWHDLERRPYVCFYAAEQILSAARAPLGKSTCAQIGNSWLPVTSSRSRYGRYFGLVRYHVFFVIRLASRDVHIAGIIPEPHGRWMEQIAQSDRRV